MMILGAEMKTFGKDYWSLTFGKCYVNTNNISTFRVIKVDCKTPAGGIESWTLFQFHMNSKEILTVKVENFTEVIEWLIGNSI